MEQSALLELLKALKAAGVDERVRIAVQSMYQALTVAESEGVIGAGFWERTESRTAVRNGLPSPGIVDDGWGPGVADPEVAVGIVLPVAAGAPTSDRLGTLAGIMEAYLHDVSTRKVDDMVKALGADTGISKSEVSRICKDLDEEVAALRDRSLAETTYPLRVHLRRTAKRE